METLEGYRIPVRKFLQEIALRAADPFPDLPEGFSVMQFRHRGCPELIFRPPFQQQRRAFPPGQLEIAGQGLQ